MAKNLIDSIAMEVKEAGVCTREFTFSVNADSAKSESAKVLNNIAGMVQLPGFRAGKAPLGMVSKKYAAEIVDELRSRYLSAAVSKIEADKSLDLLSLRIKTLDEVKVNEACNFVFEAVSAPEFELGDYNAIKLDIPVDAVADEAIAERLVLFPSHATPTTSWLPSNYKLPHTRKRGQKPPNGAFKSRLPDFSLQS